MKFSVKLRSLEADIFIRSGRDARKIVSVLNSSSHIEPYCPEINQLAIYPHAEIVISDGNWPRHRNSSNDQQNFDRNDETSSLEMSPERRTNHQQQSRMGGGRSNNKSTTPFYCLRHCPPGSGAVYSSQHDELPLVRISLRSLSSQLIRLINSHHGRLPLASLPACLAVESGFHLRFAPQIGVHLEQLISAINDIALECNQCRNSSQPHSHRSKWLTLRQQSSNKEQSVNDPASFGQLDKLWSHVDNLLSQQPSCFMPLNELCSRLSEEMGGDQTQQRHQQHNIRQTILRQLSCSAPVPNSSQGPISKYEDSSRLNSPVAPESLGAASRIFQLVGFDQLNVTYSPAYNRARFSSVLFRILRQQPDGRLSMAELNSAYRKILT